jgi:O-methyltransferase involved in polyketide biosynthesis
MTEKVAVELGDVQKTLFLPLWGRAVETQKEHPLLVDQTAVAILQQADYDFSGITHNMSELSQIAWIMRSAHVDEVVRAFVASYPRATIVDIGCGLETTFERVDNGRLAWYDLDLPDVIALRRQFIPETPRRKFIAASFLERGWLSAIDVRENVLFIAAGVFYYFKEAEVKEFLIRLADRFPRSELIFDVSSPYGVKVANQAVIKRSGLDEKSFLKWGLASTKDFAAWDRRLRVLDTYYYFGGERVKALSLKNRLIGKLSDYLKVQYMVQLEMMI